MPRCEPISDEEMEELRREAKAKQDAADGAPPIPENEEGEEGEPFDTSGELSYAQAPANQAPDQTSDDNDVAFGDADGLAGDGYGE